MCLKVTLVLEIALSVFVEKDLGKALLGGLASTCLVFSSASPLPSFSKLIEMGLHQSMLGSLRKNLNLLARLSLYKNKLQMHTF